MTEKVTKALTLRDDHTPIPVPLTITHVDSAHTLAEHIDADAEILTAQLGLLMQVWPCLTDLTDMRSLSDQVMKVLKTRRELCLKPTTKTDLGDDSIDITPL